MESNGGSFFELHSSLSRAVLESFRFIRADIIVKNVKQVERKKLWLLSEIGSDQIPIAVEYNLTEGKIDIFQFLKK